MEAKLFPRPRDLVGQTRRFKLPWRSPLDLFRELHGNLVPSSRVCNLRECQILPFSGIRLPIPNDSMRVDEVKTFYATQYAQLATAAVIARKPSYTKCGTSEPAIGSRG